jgi:hypothetical protein
MKKKKIQNRPHEWQTWLIHKSKGWTNPSYKKDSEKRNRYEQMLEAQKREYTPYITTEFVCNYLSNSDFIKNEKEREYIKYYINHGNTGIGIIGCTFYEVQEKKLKRWIMKENMKRKKKARPALRLQELLLKK